MPSEPAARPTPYVAVDVDVLDANIARMAASAAARGLALRPHVKTHKTVEIARRQLDAGAVGITVATVAEAERFVATGFDDVFVAYPIWVDPARGRRLAELADRASLAVGVDSVKSAQMIATHAGVQAVDVLVEVDCGHHRTGVAPGEAGKVAAAAARAGLTVRGVFTFPGHSYGPASTRADAATDEAVALRRACAAVRAESLEVQVLSGGSTPSAGDADGDTLSEIRPGVYVLNDAQQLEIGSCGLDDVALAVHATVVSRADGRVVLDAGSKVLATDRAVWATGHGRLLDHLDARVVALSEHHATVAFPPGDRVPELGEVVRVAPNHVCVTVNLVDELVVVRDGVEIDVWPVAARGANT